MGREMGEGATGVGGAGSGAPTMPPCIPCARALSGADVWLNARINETAAAQNAPCFIVHSSRHSRNTIAHRADARAVRRRKARESPILATVRLEGMGTEVYPWCGAGQDSARPFPSPRRHRR